MAFPTNPSDQEIYTTPLGTVYKYILADTAWKIVGAVGGATGHVGPGTVGTIAMFTPDTTTVGDSLITQYGGNTVEVSAEAAIFKVTANSATDEVGTIRVGGHSDTAPGDNDALSRLELGRGQNGDGARIDAVAPSSWADGTQEIKLQFYTRDSLNQTSLVSTMDSSGNMAVGPSNAPSSKFHIYDTDNGIEGKPTIIIQDQCETGGGGYSHTAIDMRIDGLATDMTNVVPSADTFGVIRTKPGSSPSGLEVVGVGNLKLQGFGDGIQLNYGAIAAQDSSSVAGDFDAIVFQNNGTSKDYFMGNGAIGIGKNSIYGAPITIDVTKFMQTGYANNAAAVSAGLKEGDFYRNLEDPAKVCIVISSFSIIYDGNGNTGGSAPADPSSPYVRGSICELIDKGTLVKTSYAFTGWGTEPNGSGTNYAVGSMIPMTSELILYAQWAAI